MFILSLPLPGRLVRNIPEEVAEALDSRGGELLMFIKSIWFVAKPPVEERFPDVFGMPVAVP